MCLIFSFLGGLGAEQRDNYAMSSNSPLIRISYSGAPHGQIVKISHRGAPTDRFLKIVIEELRTYRL